MGGSFRTAGHLPLAEEVERRGPEATVAALQTAANTPLPVGFEIALWTTSGTRGWRMRKVDSDRWEFEEGDGAGVPSESAPDCARCHAEAVRERLFIGH